MPTVSDEAVEAASPAKAIDSYRERFDSSCETNCFEKKGPFKANWRESILNDLASTQLPLWIGLG